MMKTAVVATCAGLLLGACAPRGYGGYGPGMGPGYVNPIYGSGYGHSHGMRRGCPPGTTPMGKYGCAGETITDQSALAGFAQPHAHCREGATKLVWKEGTDSSGRHVRWRIPMTCRREPGPAASAEQEMDE